MLTSCSGERPPKKTATRVFILSGLNRVIGHNRLVDSIELSTLAKQRKCG